VHVKKQFLSAILAALPIWTIFATDPEPRCYETCQVLDQECPFIDGTVTEDCWDKVLWASEFTEYQPEDGTKPTRETAFKIIYDQRYVYVAFRCFDPEPEKIVRRMSRRDGFAGDWVEINFDSYFDKRTAFSFTISASGVKSDEFISSDGNNWDSNWNPIWHGKTSIDSLGWTAEIRIPLTQLRYGNKDEHIWGIQVTRRDFRADERSTWQYIPRNTNGWVSKFGQLAGISGIKPQKQVEIQPYVIASAEKFQKIEGNPFADGSDSKIDVGLDGKIGITSDLTLDFTINPDFGQVEADPSSLTLDGFQIFFDERRPFFVENNNLFDFRITQAQAGGPFGNDQLFYSRRIGAAPMGSISAGDDEYVNIPDVTSILGAAKFSGKTKNGTALGIMESVTGEEKGMIRFGGDERSEMVEPLTNWFIGYVSQDFKQGKSSLGGMFTAVNRRLEGSVLEDQFHKNAYTGGLDYRYTWKERQWVLTANMIFSRVAGSAAAIENTQRSFTHYFQRPDAGHLLVDSTRTDLSGIGGNVSIANYGGDDNLSFQTGVSFRSPGLELNDAGFLNSSDQINHYFWGGYRFPDAFSIFRSFRINYNHWSRWDFDGENLYQALNTNAHAGFTNFWSAGTGLTLELKDISNRALFGGPLMRQTPGFASWFYINSDSRKKFTAHFNGFGFHPWQKHKGAIKVESYRFSLQYQPTNAVRISVTPRFFRQNRAIQNVSSTDFMEETRYITGRVIQRTFSTSFRLSVNLSPNLTVQYWGQPFISKGNYSEFNHITDPLAKLYQDRYHLFGTEEIRWDDDDGTYLIDEDGDGVTDYDFSNPDFSFIQFRSNMVLRWEYQAGSELFLVWSQSGTTSDDPQAELIHSLRNNIFGEDPHNIFLLKLTYRFLK